MLEVVFLGTVTKRRQGVLADVHSSTGIKIHTSNNAHDLSTKSSIFSRFKICLSIGQMNFKFETNDMARISEVVSNKGFIICEESGDPIEERLREYIPFVEFNNRAQLIETINYYLTHEEERLAKIEAAYEFLKREFNMANLVPEALRKLGVLSET